MWQGHCIWTVVALGLSFCGMLQNVVQLQKKSINIKPWKYRQITGIRPLKLHRSHQASEASTLFQLSRAIGLLTVITISMKIVVLLLATAVALTSSASLFERSVAQFGNMITCLGDISILKGIEYNGYGCYCGYGGSGTALDDTDRCCKEHDECYDRALESEVGCNSFDIYASLYHYEQTDTGGKCVIACTAAKDYSWINSWKAKCRAFMCECDRKGAQCFADKRHTFSKSNVGYDKNTC